MRTTWTGKDQKYIRVERENIPVLVAGQNHPDWGDFISNGVTPYVALIEVEPTLEEWRDSLTCTRLQGILILGEIEVARLDAFIDNLPNNWALRQIVDNSQTWHRNSQDIQMLGFALNYTPDQMDALFIAAAGLEQ